MVAKTVNIHDFINSVIECPDDKKVTIRVQVFQ